MKTSKFLTLFAIIAVAALSMGAHAAGFNVASLVSPEIAMGISLAAGAGMINYVQDGDSLPLTPAADVASGVGYLFGAALFGVAQGNVTSGTAGVFLTEGVVQIAKTNSLAIAVGDRVFWDATNSCVNKTVTAQQCVGVCVEAVAVTAGLLTVKIKLGCGVPVAT